MSSNLPTHSLLGASSMSRWSVCSGSYVLEKQGLGDDGDTSYADIGSDAHDIAADCLKNGKDLWEFYSDERLERLEDLTAVNVYIDYINSLRAKAPKYREWIEEKIQLSTDIRGTVDYAISFTDMQMLEVVDYKNGTGVYVDAVNNLQGMYYAWLLITQRPEGAISYILQYYPNYIVRITIVQPNYFGAAPVRSWDIPFRDLITWGDEVLQPAIHALKQKTTADFDDFVNGSHCQFCKVALDCPLMQSKFNQYLAFMKTGRGVEDMNSAELDMYIDSADNVSSFIKKLKFAVEGRLLAGESFQNAKLVQKKATSRKWKEGSDRALVSAYGTEVFTKPELKSPAVIEKEFAGSKTLTAQWAFTPENEGVTVAHRSDRRPAVTNNKAAAKDVFGGVDWSNVSY